LQTFLKHFVFLVLQMTCAVAANGRLASRLWSGGGAPHEVIAVDYEARTGGGATGSGARILVRVPGGVKRVDGRGLVWCIA
ncbi:hypothetical protein ALP48_102132, partial [Pseudomonas syringae pv. solidagae]